MIKLLIQQPQFIIISYENIQYIQQSQQYQIPHTSFQSQYIILSMQFSYDLQQSLKLLPNKQYTNMLIKIQQSIGSKKQQQLFKIAKHHLLNAIYYRAPRLNTQLQQHSCFFKIIYQFQTSHWKNYVYQILSYIFMYSVCFSFKKPQNIQIYIQCTLLTMFWIDILMEIYHKYYEKLRKKSKFQRRFYYKFTIVSLLTLDQIWAILGNDTQKFIRPFLILRCFLLIIYNPSLRKNIQAMTQLYKDIIVYLIFYVSIITFFAIFLHQVVQIPEDKKQNYNQYTQNYVYLDKILINTYFLSSFEGFPDNYLKIFTNQPKIIIAFVVFIFLNVFFFLTIPTSLLFKTFKDARSKIILIDQIKQQNSLIFAFICLSQNSNNGIKRQIQGSKLIRFLLYTFKNKIGYIEYIMQIVLKLDENINKRIQVSQFMQTCKLMAAHGSIYPPLFYDWEPWINFRKYINTKFGLKDKLLSYQFNILLSVIILISIMNAICTLYWKLQIFHKIDNVFAYIFIFELILKLIGIGPQNFFKDTWNKLDFSIILTIFILQLLPVQQKAQALVKLFRGYKLAVIFKYITDKNKYIQKSAIYIQASRLIIQTLMTIPIAIQFFHLYLITFYFFSIPFIQYFSFQTPTINQKQSPFSLYHKYSNFNTFINAQFYMIQILVEGGWSIVAYDYAYTYDYLSYNWVMISFIICHFTIVLVLNSLVKGVIWEIYEKVNQELTLKTKNVMIQEKQEKQLNQKKQQLQQIKQLINLSKPLTLQNILSREIFEHKVNRQIANKMNNALKDNRNDYLKKRSIKNRIQYIPNLWKDLQLNIDQLQMSEQLMQSNVSIHFQENQRDRKNREFRQKLINKLITQRIIDDALNIASQNKQIIDEKDIQQQIQLLITKAVVDKSKTYIETIIYPKQLEQYLNRKLKTISQYNMMRQEQKRIERQKYDKLKHSQMVQQQIQRSKLKTQYQHDIKKDSLQANEQSLKLLVHSLTSLLNKKTQKRHQKSKIITYLIESEVITQQQGKRLLLKKQQNEQISSNVNWILRKTFLSTTSQHFIEKFQIQYFSSIYGDQFKQINKKTIKPLLAEQCKIIYSLRNILKYRQINDQQFFHMLLQIQSKISKNVLKSGSICKFIYQIDSINQSWFTIKYNKQSNRYIFNFIKNGIWVYHKNMRQKEIYVGKDIFYWQQLQQQQISNIQYKNQCEKYIKFLYQSFETISYSLKDYECFYHDNPNTTIYDLFSYYKNVQQTERIKERRFSVSKVMLVILSNQGSRKLQNNEVNELSYELTDIKQRKSDHTFQAVANNINDYQLGYRIKDKLLLEQQNNRYDIFDKLRKIQNMDEEEIHENEGLPHGFIVNLIEDIQDLLSLYIQNFVYHVERVLNKEQKGSSFQRSYDEFEGILKMTLNE